MRIIMHIDMDHFFAAIEERENPQLKGKPVIVGSDPKEGFGRGVVSTANYIARRSGIKSGMPISRAWKLCPDGIFIPVNGELYWHVSDNIMQILRQYSDRFGQTGIDEASLDLTNKVKAYDEAEILAGDIKKEILEKEGLTCSIGIGPNKLVAKIASNYKKPNGITIVDESKIKSFLEPLPIRDLWGVGKKTEPILLEMGIKTIGDLSKYPINLLIQRFGMWGYEFHKLANGIDNNEVVENWEAKSIGRETTFEEDTSDPYFVLREVYELCKEVYEEVLQNNYLFKTVTLKIRFEDFETHTKSMSLGYTSKIEDILDVAQKLVLPFIYNKKKIRLIGIRVSNMIQGIKQMNFFPSTRTKA